MKTQNEVAMRLFGIKTKLKKLNFVKNFFLVLLIILISSFIIPQKENSKIAGTLLYDLGMKIGKRSGCENTIDALILMEAYQIIYREIGGIPNRKEKITGIKKVLKKYNCGNKVGDIIYNPRDYKQASIITINGGVTIERQVSPYILALEMMTPKQKIEFQKSLPKNLQLEYLDWEKNNLETKSEINKYLIDKKIMAFDLDNNLGDIFENAIENNNSLKLDDYNIDKSELHKLLNNQDLIQELNDQINKKK